MAARSRFRTLPLVGVAAAGVVFGHWAAYRIGVPQGRLRASILAESGHDYWFWAIKAAVILGLTGAGVLFWRHFRAGTRAKPSGIESYSATVLRLAAVQAVAFTATEIAERVAAGAPVAEMFSHHLFVLGLAVQFLTACVGAVVVVLLCRTATLVGASLARAPAARAVAPLLRPNALACAPSAVALGATGPRAPPRS
jgi:hypothetical protein